MQEAAEIQGSYFIVFIELIARVLGEAIGMTFFDLVMLDTSGKAISMDWGIIGDNSACNTELTLVDSTTTTIQQK